MSSVPPFPADDEGFQRHATPPVASPASPGSRLRRRHSLQKQSRRRRRELRRQVRIAGQRAWRLGRACRPPRPASTSTPTMRRTIFQRKCDPTTRTRMQRAVVRRSTTSSTSTRVDFSSGSSSVNARKSPKPVSARGRGPHRVEVERLASPTRRTAWRTPCGVARSGRGSCARPRCGAREIAAARARRRGR